MFTVLLACGGGELILVLLPLAASVVAALLFAVKVAGYYVVGRSLARAFPELGRTATELAGARLAWGVAAFSATLLAGLLARSFAVAAAALATMRFATWIGFEQVFIRPHVPVTGREQVGWAVVGTAWSFLLDLVAAGLCVALWYLLVSIH